MKNLRVNLANCIQRTVGLSVTLEDWLKIEGISNAVYGIDSPPSLKDEFALWSTTGQINPIMLEKMLVEIINRPNDKEIKAFVQSQRPEFHELVGKIIPKILANMCRDYSEAVNGFTDESRQEWDVFQKALFAGEVKLKESMEN